MVDYSLMWIFVVCMKICKNAEFVGETCDGTFEISENAEFVGETCDGTLHRKVCFTPGHILVLVSLIVVCRHLGASVWSFTNVLLAHVGLPALCYFAIDIGEINLTRNQT